MRPLNSVVLAWDVGSGYRTHDPCGSVLAAMAPDRASELTGWEMLYRALAFGYRSEIIVHDTS